MTDETRARPGQADGAAERSAHVLRGAAGGEVLGPCVEVSPGVWRLRALVEADARTAELERERDECERGKKTAAAIWGATAAEINAAFSRGAEAMREAAAIEAGHRPVETMVERIRALPLPECGE